MAQEKSRIKNSYLILLMVLAIGLSYAGPTLLGFKSPRLTPKDALSPLQIKDLEAQALRQEIVTLNERLAMLVARTQLSDKAQELAVEKSKEAQDAFNEAQNQARLANDAFGAADLKEKEAKEALAYARMTEQQARTALKLASEKEKIAQLALQEAEQLQQEASKALANAQSQSKLASQTLAEIEALEQKIAELNAGLEQDPAIQKDEAESDESAIVYQNRRLPNPGSAVIAFEDRLVPQHNITILPKDLNELDVKARKETFIKLLLPLIVQANDVISARRVQLMKAIETGDEAVIARLAKLYGLAKFDGDDQALQDALLKRVAPVPNSLALAQAAVESGWGQSRFAKEGNALFGQWAWSADAGIKPLDASNSRAVIRSFATIYDSVFAYMHNLNTHYAYQDFRDVRAQSLADGKLPSGLSLARYLTAYAELGEKYVYTLQAMILHNRFDIYETYQLKS